MVLIPLSIESVRKEKLPLGVISIIAINIWFQDLREFITVYTDLWKDKNFINNFDYWTAYNPMDLLSPGFLLSMFTHGDWLHLVGNMFFLWLFGWILEDKLGAKKFLGLYVLSGLIGQLTEAGFVWGAHGFSDDGIMTYKAIGSSGAVAGVMGMSLLRCWNLKVKVLNPLVYPLLLGLFLLIFFPEKMSDSFAILFPFLCFLPRLYKIWIMRWPLWAFTLFFFTMEYINVFQAAWDGIDHMSHAFSFLAGVGIGVLLRFPDKNLNQIYLEDAREESAGGYLPIAVSLYQDYIKDNLRDGNVRFELAEVYEKLAEESRYRKIGYREKALHQFQKAMEFWMGEGKDGEAVKLYRKLRGTYSDDEFRPEILNQLKSLGEKDPSLSLDNTSRRFSLEEEVRKCVSEGHYLAAHPCLEEWWKLGHLEDTEPAFLTIVADVLRRNKDAKKEEIVLEYLSEHGDLVQASRSLLLLGRRWLGTPKQLRLKPIFQQACNRLPDLRLNNELVELEQGLK